MLGECVRICVAFLATLGAKMVNSPPSGSSPLDANEGDTIFVDDRVRRKITKKLHVVVVFVGLVGFVTSPWEASLRDGILISLLIAMCWLRLHCYNELKFYFTFDLGVRPGHKLIRSGAYAYLVHPSYTAQIGYNVALLLLFDVHWFIVCSYCAYVIYAVYNRTKAEENGMREKFGEEYDEYLRRRKRFIPFVF
jgi:protein-S-isoprenylcysteine O-methyltransferase Ste14